MNTYAPGLFRYLDEQEKIEFELTALDDFLNAEDDLVIKAVHHPVYRLRLAHLAAKQAGEELEKINVAHNSTR